MKKLLIAILTLLCGVFSSIASEKVPFEGYFVLFSNFDYGVNELYNTQFAYEDISMPITDITQFRVFYLTKLGDVTFDEAEILRKCRAFDRSNSSDFEFLCDFSETLIYPDSIYTEMIYILNNSVWKSPYFRCMGYDDKGRDISEKWVYQIVFVKGTASILSPDSWAHGFIKRINYIQADKLYYFNSIESIDNFVGLDFYEAWVPGFDCKFAVGKDWIGRDNIEGLIVEIYDKESVEKYSREDFRYLHLREIDKRPVEPKAEERFFVGINVPDTCESADGYITELMPYIWRMKRFGVDTTPFQLNFNEGNSGFKSAEKMASMLMEQAFKMAPYLHADWAQMAEMDSKLVKLVYIKGKSETLPYNGKNPRVKLTSIQKYNPYVAVRSLRPHNFQVNAGKF